MRVLYLSVTLSTLLAAGACGRDPQAFAAPGSGTPTVTDAASQLQAGTPAPAPVAAPTPQPVRRTQPVQTYRTPAPVGRVETVTHVKRDAAIGAGVGAAAGAIIHDRNRVKGAIVGGVLGGVAGAAVGWKIDKSTRVVYP